MCRKRVTQVAGYRSIVETSLHSIAMVLFYRMARSGVQFYKIYTKLHHIIKSRVERAECSKCSPWGKVRGIDRVAGLFLRENGGTLRLVELVLYVVV